MIPSAKGRRQERPVADAHPLLALVGQPQGVARLKAVCDDAGIERLQLVNGDVVLAGNAIPSLLGEDEVGCGLA